MTLARQIKTMLNDMGKSGLFCETAVAARKKIRCNENVTLNSLLWRRRFYIVDSIETCAN
jgi:hypothetical protein